ncbi:MAG TPA: virulence factor [Anaerolineae bacterium]|nr:virulence factor [Anaerolineae bacterium]
MAQVQIYFWKDIPYGVRARDENGRVTKQLPRAFEATVDAAAMAEGQTDAKDYQSGFRWGDPEERPGSAEEAAQVVVDEIVTAYPSARLAKLARREPA